MTRWVRGLWEYYREYTHTAVHAAATAALTGFGLLAFIDPLFVVIALGAYVFPPVALYSLGTDVGTRSSPAAETSVRAESGTNADSDSDSDTDTDDGDTDSDGDDGDSDSDGKDADADGADADADG
ncbi:hypothetical protein [Halorussus amylolyticus]|uniref:hypothetical protein n=1 Tax=Halorussus amylolyticus TaxID=1126242 RepID=UPI00138F3986|nr:hypothetical protein [Halorussus amylolyticus]